jgi:hypothetical protein
MKLVFIAGRFAGANAWEIARNTHAAEAVALQVAELGGMPVVPHSLGRSMFGTLPEEFWRAGCLELLGRCDGILLLPSWSSSPGAGAEARHADKRGIRRWGIGHLKSAAFFRWLNYPAERGASIQAASARDKARQQ